MFFYIDNSKCTNCKLCLQTCKKNGLDIIQMGKNGKPVINILFNLEVKGKSYMARTGKGCNKCQDCNLICPEQAIEQISQHNGSKELIDGIVDNLNTDNKEVSEKIRCTKENIVEYIGIV